MNPSHIRFSLECAGITLMNIYRFCLTQCCSMFDLKIIPLCPFLRRLVWDRLIRSQQNTNNLFKLCSPLLQKFKQLKPWSGFEKLDSLNMPKCIKVSRYFKIRWRELRRKSRWNSLDCLKCSSEKLRPSKVLSHVKWEKLKRVFIAVFAINFQQRQFSFLSASRNFRSPPSQVPIKFNEKEFFFWL